MAFGYLLNFLQGLDVLLTALCAGGIEILVAAGCSRDVIKDGAERLGWTLDEVLDKTIQAMRSCEASVADELNKLC
jgi:hypothetical protein